MIEKGRHDNLQIEDRLCVFCGHYNIRAIEDEYHVLFECCVYEEIRNLYLRKHFSCVNQFNFILLLTSADCILDVANYISGVFKMRKSLL